MKNSALNRHFLKSKDSMKCTVRNSINQYCDENLDCKSELCSNKRCIPQNKPKGAGCTCDEECDSGECSFVFKKFSYKCE